MRPLELFQGEDKTLKIEMSDDISAATEIEFYIDTSPQIKKTLSDGEISNVSSTEFYVQIDAADTTSVDEGSYKFQARATISSKVYHIRFTPNKIKIKESIFITENALNDYGE